MEVLVVNAGSSSLKLSVIDGADRAAASMEHPPLTGTSLTEALTDALMAGGSVAASGHRLVHGGERLRRPTVVDATIDAELHAAADLAPRHNPPALSAIESLRRLRPELPIVACFDTAFHATLPAEANTYALPAAWSDRWSLPRYGSMGSPTRGSPDVRPSCSITPAADCGL